MKLGDAFLSLAVAIWVTVAVGPWYVGVGLFCFSWMLNILETVIRKRRT